MTCRAAFAALRSLLVGSDTPASGRSLPPTSGATSGHVRLAYPLPRDVGEAQLPALRLALLLESKRAKHLRQSKLAAQCEADLRRVTHAILAKGSCSDV